MIYSLNSKHLPKLGIVIPAYNEAGNIVALVREVARIVPHAVVRVVDDSPNFTTVTALANAAIPNATVEHRDKKSGRGSAVICGIRYLREAGCDVVVEMDADFSHPPSQLPALVNRLTDQGADMVVASRYLPDSQIENWPMSRKLFSRAANWLAKTLLSVPVSDYTNGYRAYSRPAMDVILAHCGKLGVGFIALSEILVNIYYRGLRVTELPTKFVNRLRGESSVNATELKHAIVGLMKIFWLKRQLTRDTSLRIHDIA